MRSARRSASARWPSCARPWRATSATDEDDARHGEHAHHDERQEEAGEVPEAGDVVVDLRDARLGLGELLAQARDLDVEALHLVAELLYVVLARVDLVLHLGEAAGQGVDRLLGEPDLLASPL